MSELGPDARELIRRVGDADGPAPSARARVKRSLVLAIAAGASTAAGTTGAAAKTAVVLGAAAGKAAAGAGVLQIGGWFLAGSLLGAAVLVPVALTGSGAEERSRSERAAAPAVVAQAPAPANAAPHATAPPIDEAALAEQGPPVPADARPAPNAAPAPHAAPAPGSPPEPEPSALAREVQLLEDVQRELALGNAARALALLDAHRAAFPRGALRGERMAARVFALCALGRVDEARRDARLFLAFAPESPLVPRLLASCASQDSETDPGRTGH